MIQNGQVYLEDKVVSDFEGYFQLKPGINIHINHDIWERTKEERMLINMLNFIKL